MKRGLIAVLLSLVATTFFIGGCGEKYSDVKKVNEEYIQLVEKYISDMDKATSAKDAAKAINSFGDGMEKVLPEMKKMSEKYPELKNNVTPPEELKESQMKAEATGKKMVGAMMKIMPYMRDPEVQTAQKRLSTIMMKMTK